MVACEKCGAPATVHTYEVNVRVQHFCEKCAELNGFVMLRPDRIEPRLRPILNAGGLFSLVPPKDRGSADTVLVALLEAEAEYWTGRFPDLGVDWRAVADGLRRVPSDAARHSLGPALGAAIVLANEPPDNAGLVRSEHLLAGFLRSHARLRAEIERQGRKVDALLDQLTESLRNRTE
ncbi:MAG: hypothetical protein AMXMBFR47_43350 [Planctomycetota bacterium]